MLVIRERGARIRPCGGLFKRGAAEASRFRRRSSRTGVASASSSTGSARRREHTGSTRRAAQSDPHQRVVWSSAMRMCIAVVHTASLSSRWRVHRASSARVHSLRLGPAVGPHGPSAFVRSGGVYFRDGVAASTKGTSPQLLAMPAARGCGGYRGRPAPRLARVASRSGGAVTLAASAADDKGWLWVAEMEEIARAFGAVGLLPASVRPA